MKELKDANTVTSEAKFVDDLCNLFDIACENALEIKKYKKIQIISKLIEKMGVMAE